MKQLLLVAVISLIALLSGCSGGNKPTSDNLIVALAAEPATLDPRYATDATGMRIGALIFNSLVRVGEGFKPIPDAAERWEQNGHNYTFFLRPNLHFHNGRVLEPADVEFSFAYYRSKQSPFASVLDGIKKVEVKTIDGRIRVDILASGAGDKFLLSDLPAVKLLPKAEIESSSTNFAKTLPGTGPFRFSKAEHGEIQLDSISAKIPRLTFKIVRDDLTRFQKVIKGEIDIAQTDLPVAKIKELEARSKELRVIRYPGLATTYLLINFTDPLLGRKDVRKALAYTINRNEIIKYKLFDLATEATSILTPNNPYFENSLENPKTDPTSARSIIEKLGWQGRSLILKTSSTPQAVENGRVIAHQISASSLQVQVQSFEWGTFYEDIKKGQFQLALMRWVGTVDPDIYRLAFHSKEKPPGRNRGSYVNPALDPLLDKAAFENDIQKRKQIYSKVQKLVHQDLAIIPLWYDLQVAVIRSEVKGYKPSPTSDFWPFTEVSKK